MSTRTPIQVPEELKEKIENLKDQMHAKTHYEVIDRLIQYRIQAKQEQETEREKQAQEKQRQKNEDVNLGAELKEQCTALADKLGLRSPAAVIDLLLHHFEYTNTMNKETFDHYIELRKGGHRS